MCHQRSRGALSCVAQAASQPSRAKIRKLLYHRFQSGGFLLVMYNRRDRRVIPSRNSRGTFHPRGKRCHDSLDLSTINPIMLQDFAVGLWFRRLQKRVRKIRFFLYCIQDSPISSFHLQKSRLYALIFWFYPLLCKGHLSIFDLCWGDFTTPPSYYIGRLFQIFNHPRDP